VGRAGIEPATIPAKIAGLLSHKTHCIGVCLKISEPKLRMIGSAGGRAKTKPPFRPPRLEAEAKRTISSFSQAVARK